MKTSKPRAPSPSTLFRPKDMGDAVVVSHKEVRKEDILLGRRGRGIRMHSGTVAFRAFINSRISEYERVKSRAQRINAVALATKSILDSGARILKPSSVNAEEQWVVMDERSSCEKVGMAIRDSIKARHRHSKAMGKGDDVIPEKTDVPSFTTILNQVIGGLDERDGVDREQEQQASGDKTSTKTSSNIVSNQPSPQPARPVLNSSIRNVQHPHAPPNKPWLTSASPSPSPSLLRNAFGTFLPPSMGMPQLSSSARYFHENAMSRQQSHVLEIFVDSNDNQSGRQAGVAAEGPGSSSRPDSSSSPSYVRDLQAIDRKLANSLHSQDLSVAAAMFPHLFEGTGQRSTLFQPNSTPGSNHDMLQYLPPAAAAQQQSMTNQIQQASALLFRQQASLLRSRRRHDAIVRSQQAAAYSAEEGETVRCERILNVLVQQEQDKTPP